MNAAENVNVVHECYAAFGLGDLERMLATLATDLVWELPASSVIPWAGRFEGHEGFTRFLTALGTYADAESFEPRHFIADGEYVVVLGRERFRVKSTGKTWTTEWAHAFTVVDGKITTFYEHTDTAAIAAAFA